MSKRVGLTLLICLMTLAATAGALTVDRWLVQGPYDIPAPLFGEGGVLPQPPADLRPAAGDLWRIQEGRADLGKADHPRTVLLAAYLDLDAHGEITLEVKTDALAAVSLAGETVVELEAGVGRGDGTTTLTRGRHLLLVRALVEAGECLRVDVKAEAAAVKLSAHINATHLLTRFDDNRLFTSVSSLALSPDGKRLLVLLRNREEDGSRVGRLELRDAQSGSCLKTLAVGSPSQPAWLPAGRSCSWRQDGALHVADLETGTTRRLLVDEPGLGQVAWSPEEQYLTFLSAEDADDLPENRRLTELRERLSDWNDRVVLHRLDLSTGFRQPLTATGDFQVMNFALSQDGEHLALVRKVPRKGRPFFFSEIWVMGADGSDPRLLTTLQYGFEIWPDNLAWSPDGSRIAFTGPAGEVGDGRPDHNWATTHIWTVDVADGSVELLSRQTIDDRSGAGLCWDGDDALLFISVRGHKR